VGAHSVDEAADYSAGAVELSDDAGGAGVEEALRDGVVHQLANAAVQAVDDVRDTVAIGKLNRRQVAQQVVVVNGGARWIGPTSTNRRCQAIPAAATLRRSGPGGDA
jgi:hypothetical protein